MAVTSVIRGKRLDPEARRAQLIELGLQELESRGELAALDRISQKAGISRGLLFHYFPTKRAYRVAVVRAAAERLLDVTDPAPTLDPISRLRAGLRGFSGFVSENRSLYLALLRGAAGADPELVQIFDATRERIVEVLVEGLGVSAEIPIVRTSLRGWVGFVEESTLEWLRHGGVDRDVLVQVQEQTLIRLMETIAPLTLD
jgi:AcrR family transcriptional regulator